jgi:hypothetical protein
MSSPGEASVWVKERASSAHLAREGYPTAFVCVFLAWALLALPWLTGAVVVPYDATAHFYPQLQFLARALNSGDSPAWTPHIFAGSPQIADPQSLIFSPAYLLAYLDPAPSLRLFDAYLFAVLLAGCLGVIMIFRDRGWHPAGAVLAALAFGFGASANERIQHVTQVQGLVFFVIALWLLGRVLDRRSLLYGVLAGAAVALMVATPGQVQVLGCYFLAGYVVTHWLSDDAPARSFRQSIAPLTVAAVTTLVLAGLPILMTYLFGMASNRPHVPFADAGRGSLHPASLLTAFIADLYGANDPVVSYWGPSNGHWTQNSLLAQNMGQVYVGVLPMVALLLCSVAQTELWHRHIRFFAAALIASILYAIGTYTPLFAIAFNVLPGVDLFRRPADATFFIGAMLAIFSGYGLHLLLTGEGKETASRTFAIVAGLFAFVFGLGLLFAVREGHLADAVKPLIVAAVLTLLAFALTFAVTRRRDLPAALAVCIVAGFMAVDLAVNNGPNESTALPVEEYSEIIPNTTNATVAFLKANTQPALPSDRRDRVELVGLGFEWPNTGQTHGYDHTLGYNPLRLRPISRALGAGDTIAVAEQRRFTPLFPSYNSHLADLLGLRYIVTPVPIDRIDRSLRPGDLTEVRKTVDGFIYENKRALPRVLFVSRSRRADFEAIIKTGQWPGFDPRETVLLEEAPRLPSARASGVIPQSPAARLTAYRNTEVIVDVDAERPGFLVLNDIWHPWWFAEVDGRETQILKANVMFRAVMVPAGHHQVRFRFRPIRGVVHEVASLLGLS